MNKRSMLLVAVIGMFLMGVSQMAACPPNICTQITNLVDSTIVEIGDSILAYNESDGCRSAGGDLSIMLNKEVFRYPVIGAWLENTDPAKDDIVAQFTRAKNAHPTANTVVMDGGANDLYNMCTGTELPACADDIARNISIFGNFIDTLKTRGITKIVVVLYYPAISGVFLPYVESFNSYDNQLINLCAQKGCRVVDLRPVFAGHPEWIIGDGIHPTVDGSYQIATAINGAFK